MTPCIGHLMWTCRRVPWSLLAAFALPPLLAACQPEPQASAPEVRPVRTVTVERREAGVPITLTGRIEAEDEVAIALRISGRVLENGRPFGQRGRHYTMATKALGRVGEFAQNSIALVGSQLSLEIWTEVIQLIGRNYPLHEADRTVLGGSQITTWYV